MERITSYVLTIALPIAIIGALFKLMHWQGANVMLITGLNSVAIASLIKYASEKTFDGYIAGFTIALACIGILYRLMHWPFSDWMLKLAVAGGIIWAVKYVFTRNNRQ